MNKKEYLDNQKKQRKAFKEYRKRVVRMFGGFAFALLSFFVLPEYVLAPIHNFLLGLCPASWAAGIDFGTIALQFGLVAGGVVHGVYNGFKAITSKKAVDKAQDEEEAEVEGIIDNLEKAEEENAKLKDKNNQLQAELDKYKSEVRTDSITESKRIVYTFDNNEEEKKKKL